MNKGYRVKDLRVGTLGMIDCKKSGEVYWNKKKANPYFVYENIYDDKVKETLKGKDILSDEVYYYFIDKRVSNQSYAIGNNVPLNIFIEDENISLQRIKELVCTLNVDNAMLKYKDDILLRVKDAMNKLDKISDYDRENIIDKLSYLTEEYINLIVYPNVQFEDMYQNTTLQILEVLEELKNLLKNNKKKRKRR